MLQRHHLLSLLLVLIPAAAAAGEAEAPPPEAAPPESVATPESAPPAEPAEAGAATEATEEAPGAWSGYANVREEWRGRFASGGSEPSTESDHTLRLFLDADGRNSNESMVLKGSLGLWWRIAEDYNDPSEIAPVRDEFELDVYTLAAEWRPRGLIESLEVGRQTTDHGRPGVFDGLSLSLRPAAPVEVFAFGGRSVHYFEIDPSVFENWMASFGVLVRGSWWRIEADYRFLSEDVPSTPANPLQPNKSDPVTKARVSNNSYGLTAWARYGDWFNARVFARGIDDKYESVGGAISAAWLEQELGVDVRFDMQPSTLSELNLFDDPYTLTLGASKPHFRLNVDLYKNFSTSSAGFYGIHLGGELRQLLYGEDESEFNRNLERAYLVLSAQRINGTGLYASVIGEVYRSPNPVSDSNELIYSAGGALGWDQKPVRAEVGTNFYRWRYHYYQVPEEISDVREFYGEVKVKVLDWLALRARYSYEIFDTDIQTVTVSVVEAL